MGLASYLVEILSNPSIGDAISDLVILVGPLWIAVSLGVLVGWFWKPNWAHLGLENFHASASKDVRQEPSSSRSGFGSIPGLHLRKSQLRSCIYRVSDDVVSKEEFSSTISENSTTKSSSFTQREKGTSRFVTDQDLKYLHQLVEVKDGGPAWIHMMNRSTQSMSYQAWRRDMENGPPQYRSTTVYENATPEMLRDFFWDNEFRLKWDDMHISGETLEECQTTGAMVVHWLRKFPFFCSDREYTIGRRIWDAGRAYYCVTKGVPYPAVPRRNKPRRVDLYFSSWFIRPVESRIDGQMTASEVTLFHYEDMGIPWELAKLGVRQGMWGAVKTAESGFRAYQKHRASSSEPLSESCLLAHINSKITDQLRSLEENSGDSSPEKNEISDSSQKPSGKTIPKLLVVGGAIAVACSLDKGLLTKALIFGVARRFANIGRRM